MFVFICKQKTSPSTLSRFSGDIAKICKLLILGTLGMLGCTHPQWLYQLAEDFDVYLHAKNKFHHSLFLRYYILKNPAIWLADRILADNSRNSILADMGMVVKYQKQPVFRYSSHLTLCQKSEKTIDPFLKKMPNWRTDRQKDRQTPSIGRGPIKDLIIQHVTSNVNFN